MKIEGEQFPGHGGFIDVKTQDFDIRITGAHEIRSATRMSRWEMIRHEPSPVDVTLKARFALRGKDRLVFQLEARYTGVRALVRRELLNYAFETVFDIAGLETLVELDGDEVLLPRDLLVTVLNISIGAMRGAIAVRTAGTFLANYPLPLFDLRSIVGNIEEAPREARNRFPSIEVVIGG